MDEKGRLYFNHWLYSHAVLQMYVVTSGGEANAIGSCGIGPQETNQAGRQHWADMIHNPRKPTAMWHIIR